MIINTRSFGELDIKEKEKIHFKDGLYGFEDKRDFVLLNNHDTQEPVPFMWLQSTEDPDLAFVVTIPFFLKSDYEIEIAEDVCSSMDLTQPSEVGVYSICKIEEDVEHMTVNLISPLIINANTRQGRQVVLYDSGYSANESIIK